MTGAKIVKEKVAKDLLEIKGLMKAAAEKLGLTKLMQAPKLPLR
ncbi:hypothetical protein QUF99_02265 [Bacillus sp. DX4.1]|nr:hypothetical protein [Bacillus sp. DX4.1]MDM5186281.1 hypothetical protein [Bacillus sp. DX4.1]